MCAGPGQFRYLLWSPSLQTWEGVPHPRNTFCHCLSPSSGVFYNILIFFCEFIYMISLRGIFSFNNIGQKRVWKATSSPSGGFVLFVCTETYLFD